MGEAGHRERFRDLHDTELVSGHYGSSLFLDVAHKIFTDHGGSLLLDPRSHSAFPMIIRLPRTYRPEGPLAPAGGS
jgi:ectoine hydroxylase-related dioxygenase (phytanoyl-CoA dioxygenase family)